jgi:cytoskeletal protein CcmA (bactofilin family)
MVPGTAVEPRGDQRTTGDGFRVSRVSNKPEEGKLSVGKGIRIVATAIDPCEWLSVHGNVEAALNNCKRLEIGETGKFTGSARVIEAEIWGTFEGKLQVDRLIIRASGKVRGDIKYVQIELASGGELSGTADAVGRDRADYLNSDRFEDALLAHFAKATLKAVSDETRVPESAGAKRY